MAEPQSVTVNVIGSLVGLVDQLDRIEAKVDRLLGLSRFLKGELKDMAGELDALSQQVQANTDTEQSAIVLLNGLKQKLDEAIATGDIEKVKSLSAALGTSQQKLADAVTANTPADPNQPPMGSAQKGKQKP
jgi:hypothetical protein